MEQNILTLPKIDLHCHLDGSMGLKVTAELLKEQGVTMPDAELLDRLQVSDDCTSLAEYLKRFDLPIQCLNTKEAIRLATKDLYLSASDENVKYLEVRFAPLLLTNPNLSVRDTLEGAVQGMRDAENEKDIRGGIIVCGMRHHSLEDNLKLLEQSRDMLGSGVCALDLAGDEAAFPTSEQRELFLKAKSYEMPYTIHSGECGSVVNIREAMDLGATRMGHGIAMAKDIDLMKECASRHIGVEMCPTSNLQTKAVSDWSQYPFKTFMEYGVPVSINTDNRMVSNTNMTKELSRIAADLDEAEPVLRKIYEASVEMAFADDDCKHELLKK